MATPYLIGHVLHLVIETAEVSWEQIRDFKSDPDSRSKFLALRNWITDKAYSNRSIAEIDEELEFLLDDYEHYMQQQKLKYEMGTLQLLVVSSLEIIENLARLQFSKIAKKLFSFEERNAAFLESWRDAPGREVAYISASQERFESGVSNGRRAE